MPIYSADPMAPESEGSKSEGGPYGSVPVKSDIRLLQRSMGAMQLYKGSTVLSICHKVLSYF